MTYQLYTSTNAEANKSTLFSNHYDLLKVKVLALKSEMNFILELNDLFFT